MNTQSTISLPRKQEVRLRAVALRYGFAPDELARRIIADATRILFDMPEESLDDFCLLISLREETKLSLPNLYEGMRVFYKVEK